MQTSRQVFCSNTWRMFLLPRHAQNRITLLMWLAVVWKGNGFLPHLPVFDEPAASGIQEPKDTNHFYMFHVTTCLFLSLTFSRKCVLATLESLTGYQCLLHGVNFTGLLWFKEPIEKQRILMVTLFLFGQKPQCLEYSIAFEGTAINWESKIKLVGIYHTLVSGSKCEIK